MKNKLDGKLLLFIVFVLAFFLRVYAINKNPPSLNWDEAAFGYNAYSLGIDGKEEFGRFLPLDYLESFGDFKPPMYAYLDVIPIKIWGKTSFAVRFPSALLGSLMVIATYFLVREIFYTKKNRDWLALVSSLVLALSPWHIMLSRAGFEANVSSFFIVCGVLFFVRSIRQNRWLLILSAIFFSLSIYTFNSARVVSPLLVILLSLIFAKSLWKMKKQLVISVVSGILIILPTIGFLLTPQAGLRFKEVNIFTDLSIIENSNQQIANDQNSLLSKLLHNRRLLYSVEYARHYLDHFNPKFLFISGDGNPRFSTQDVGQLYLFDLPFLLIGLFFLLRKREGLYFLIPLWLLIGIIPAAAARETPHALRIEGSLPSFQILVAYGLITVIEAFGRNKNYILSVLAFTLFINCLYFFHGLFFHYPREYSSEWQYGYEESVNYVSGVKDQYDKVFVTNALGRPYIYYLFYGKESLQDFRDTASVKRDAFGFVTIESFDKLVFAKDLKGSKPHFGRNLFINVSKDVPLGANILKKFYLKNGDISLIAYTI